MTLAGVALLAWVGVVGYHAAAAISSPAQSLHEQADTPDADVAGSLSPYGFPDTT